MKLLLMTLAISAAAVPGAFAADTPATALQLRPKAALVTAAPQHSYAPFIAPAPEPDLDLAPRNDARHSQSRSSCDSDSALCYDPTSGRIVYKPAREFMPDIPGMRRENISVRRDRIVFRYSF